MPWTSGVTRAAGYLVVAADWNNGMGAGGNFDLLSDGTKIVNSQVQESSMEIGNAPIPKAMLTSDASQTGGLQWNGDYEEAITLSFLNM